jgi:hypothetical protein
MLSTFTPSDVSENERDEHVSDDSNDDSEKHKSPEEFTAHAALSDFHAGDRYQNARGRVYRIVRFVGNFTAVVLDEKTKREETAIYPLMLTRGWSRLGSNDSARAAQERRTASN